MAARGHRKQHSGGEVELSRASVKIRTTVNMLRFFFFFDATITARKHSDVTATMTSDLLDRRDVCVFVRIAVTFIGQITLASFCRLLFLSLVVFNNQFPKMSGLIRHERQVSDLAPPPLTWHPAIGCWVFQVCLALWRSGSSCGQSLVGCCSRFLCRSA